MRVLVFGLSANHGGVESVILNFCTEALERGLCMFDFVVIDQIPEFARYLSRFGCKFYVVPNRIKDPIGYKRGLEQALQAEQYDFVWYNVCTLSDITLLKLAKRRGVRTVLHAHNAENMGNILNGILHARHLKKVDSLVDLYVACSEDAARFIFPETVACSSGSWMLLKNAISLEDLRFSDSDRERIRKEHGLSGSKIIGHVGRLHPQKNHEKILSVFDGYRKGEPDAKLVLIGSGPLEEQISADVERRALSDDVVFLGSIENVSEWLSAFDLFLFPSRYEGLPVALLEAQANGLPCVMSDAISAEAVCSKNVRMVSLNTPDSVWVKEIEELMAGSRDQDRAYAGQAIAEKGFDITLEAPRFVDLLDQNLLR